jgi:outer membrane protein
MLKIYKVFFLLIFLINPLFVLANDNIAYIDMQFIMNKSNVGNSIIKEMDKLNMNLKKDFLTLELDFKKREKELIAKKNIMESKEFNLLVSKLSTDIKNFNVSKKNKILNLNNKKIEYDLKLINSIKPILTNYSKSKNISLLFQKKNIILGSSELDITKDILNIVNKDIKPFNYK